MTDILRPDPVLLFFFGLQQGPWLLLLLPLAAIRAVAARGPSRGLAYGAVLLCLAGLAAQYVPPLLGLYDGALFRLAEGWRMWGSGMVALLAPSALLGLSGMAPGRRWRGIDAIHALLLACLFGLWAYSAWS